MCSGAYPERNVYQSLEVETFRSVGEGGARLIANGMRALCRQDSTSRPVAGAGGGGGGRPDIALASVPDMPPVMQSVPASPTPWKSEIVKATDLLSSTWPLSLSNKSAVRVALGIDCGDGDGGGGRNQCVRAASPVSRDSTPHGSFRQRNQCVRAALPVVSRDSTPHGSFRRRNQCVRAASPVSRDPTPHGSFRRHSFDAASIGSRSAMPRRQEGDAASTAGRDPAR